jgi:hypothetical protein
MSAARAAESQTVELPRQEALAEKTKTFCHPDHST